ncbi:MAG: hypothetical protein BGO28_05425 [Alphaproteobacteria bacterium 43-37]|nr:MAG: hypothetical protein BGO28_05425 [Alphaproteobacteria bacterium 43-37]
MPTKISYEHWQLLWQKLDKSAAISRQIIVPPKGWIKYVRNTLQMKAEQLARRLGLSKSRVHQMEKMEIDGRITLQALEKAAEAMHCRLVYAFVPQNEIQSIIVKQTQLYSKEQALNVNHSMKLEGQAPSLEAYELSLKVLNDSILRTSPSKIWDTDS